MKPFCFLGSRAEDAAADGEYDAVLRYAALDESQLVRVRLEQRELGPIDLDDWSGFILGGGPFNISDPHDAKSPTQHRVETELRELAGRVVDADFPFFGACYGIGTLGSLGDGIVDRTYAEPVGQARISLTEAGAEDPLFSVADASFDALLGHKEAVRRLPSAAVLLASGEHCPVQGFRIGRNVYATQFHPELDGDGLATRVDVYAGHGYFHPDEAEGIKAVGHAAHITEPPKLLARFVELYAR